MNKRTVLISCFFFAFLSSLSISSGLVQAQTIPTGNLYNLKTAGFPTITFSVDAYGPTGDFVTGLVSKDFTILEDGQERQLDELVVFDPGVEFVVAINPGRSFAILDNQGLSRFEKITKALGAWAGNLSSDNNDAYSLITNGGPSAFHTHDPKSWLTSLNAYQPDLKEPSPSFDLLSQAIDIASTSMLEPGARRVLLFVTPMAETSDTSTLQSIALHASQLDVHVFVWVVASSDWPATPGFLALQDLAASTGGQLLLFSGSEKIPDPSDYLAPMRSGYRLTYTSGLTSSGSHSLVVNISTSFGQIDLPPLNFEMEVLPPNPILVSPPDQIIREPPEGSSYNLSTLFPSQQNFEMIIEFPDGHPRSLAGTSLLVDGQKVDENRSAPFDRFVWDLSAYTTSGKHDLQVAVVDMLGLEKVSISIPITITVAEAPTWWAVFLSRYERWIVIGGSALVALFLFFAFFGIYRKLRMKKMTLPADAKTLEENGSNERTNLHWHPRQAPAFLQPILDEGSPTGLLQLVAREIRLGSDPSKSNILLKEASIGPLHAIIFHLENNFSISDQGSLAGTWLNYERLPSGRHSLKHGDIIHFGLLAYRFLLSDPPQKPRLQITHIKTAS